MASFKMLSRLQPDSATMVGLLTAAGVYLIYNNSLPSMADIRLGPPNDNDVEAVRRGAAIKSTLLIGLVFLVARDLNSYIISGGALVGIDYMYKHHNAIEPTTGRLDAGTPPTIAPGAGAPLAAVESYGG
jgi:hypothetical protein